MSTRAHARSPALPLALAAALAACGCGTRGAETSAATPTPAPNQAAPAPAAPAPAATPAAVEAGPALAEAARVVTSESFEKNGRLGYEMKLRLPQLADPRTPQERGFNRLVRRLVERDVRYFKAACREDAKPKRADYFFGTNYEVTYATRELLGVRLRVESFTGYLNSDWSTIAVNYDLKSGRDMELDDLFRPGAKYLEAVSAYCVDELLRRGIGCGSASDEGWLREGARPEPGNYADWNLTPAGIKFTYAEYQVAPGCEGLVECVVPYGRLSEVLKPGPLTTAGAARP